ncbi:MAG TPA: flagellar basal body P-ring formation chaperone FlgA [Verrucomicrobiae bacterium]|nr:flagellar basal body P-ring formation chaperone FlgA [Verrucomicrobiae bacterium]
MKNSFVGAMNHHPASNVCLLPTGSRRRATRAFAAHSLFVPTRRLFLVLAICLAGGGGFSVRADESPAASPAVQTNTTLDAEAVTRLLTAALQKQFAADGDRLDLRLVNPWTPLPAPPGPCTVKIFQLPNSGLSSWFVVGFEIQTADGRSLGRWQCSVQAQLWREVWVARSLLKPGTPLAEADLARERRDILALHMPLAQFDDGDRAAWEVAESVPAGAPLPAWALKLRPVIRRGQTASAVVQDGALTVATRVLALEDGTPGQIIHVRNPQSNRDFYGKVLNDKTILVSL